MELDDLFSEAITAYKKIHPTSAPSLGKYADPENWIRTQSVALIHRESQTLLGNFGAFRHLTEEGCRKLVREQHLGGAILKTELVSGDWWLAEPLEPEPPPELRTHFNTTLHVGLPGLQLHAVRCPVVATLNEKGWITHIRLSLHTTFAQCGGEPQLVFFPAGTELRAEMSRACKIELFRQLRKVEG